MDFANSHVRWPFDVLIAEFNALRQEIVIVKTQVERTYAYLFALVGAILASQLLSAGALDFLDKHPWLFLFSALLTLWLPINHQLMSADMILAGVYIRDLIAPKLNHLARIGTRDLAQGPTPPADRDAFLGWTSDMNRLPSDSWLPDSVYRRLNEPMSWEQFMADVRMEASPRRRIFAPLYVARTLILYLPTLLLVYIYLSLVVLHETALFHSKVHPELSWPELGLAVVLLVALGASFMGHIATVRLFRYGTHMPGEDNGQRNSSRQPSADG